MIVNAYRDASPENMKALVEVMTFDKQRFATSELAALRSEAALARPDHLRNYVDGLPHGSPIPIKVDRDKIPSIKTPTLLIHGKDDRVLHFEVSLWLLANIPNFPARPAQPMRTLGDDRTRRRVQSPRHRLYPSPTTETLSRTPGGENSPDSCRRPPLMAPQVLT